MKSSARLRIATALGLSCVLGIAIWQFLPQPAAQATKDVGQSEANAAPAAQARAELPEAKPSVQAPVQRVPQSGPGVAFDTVMARLQPEIDAALRNGDDETAQQVVDEAVARSGLQGVDKQRLMAAKLGFLGMKGDHAGILALMDDIIALDPSSPISLNMAKQRAFIEDFAKRDPNDPGMCSTCGGAHGNEAPPIPHP